MTGEIRPRRNRQAETSREWQKVLAQTNARKAVSSHQLGHLSQYALSGELAHGNGRSSDGMFAIGSTKRSSYPTERRSMYPG